MDANLAKIDDEEDKSAFNTGVQVTKDVVVVTSTQITRFTETNTAARLGDFGGFLVSKVRDLLDNVGDEARKNPKYAKNIEKLEAQVDELNETGNVAELGGKILKSVGELGNKLKEDGVGDKILAKLDEITKPENVKKFEEGVERFLESETGKLLKGASIELGSWLWSTTGRLLNKAGDALKQQKAIQDLEDKLEDLKATKGYDATAEALGKLKETVTSEEFKQDVSRAADEAKPGAKEALAKLEELLTKFDEKAMTKESIASLQAGVGAIGETLGEATSKKTLPPGK
jgi:cell division protein FtsB